MKRISIIVAGIALAVFAIAAPVEDPPESHVKVMKDLGKQMGQIRKGVDVEQNANAMAASMKEVGAFWKERHSDVAMKTCKDSHDGAVALAKAAHDGDAAGQKAAMKMIGGGCKGCHDAHREKVSDTEYKIK
ncbi:MAG: cytochrome c [Bryobacteraceae bacterium]